MELIQTKYFKSNVTKQDIINLAKVHADEIKDMESPIDAQILFKKAKLYLDTLLTENEKSALMIWEQNKQDYPNVTYDQGGRILDYEADPVYLDLKEKLKQRKDILDMAYKQKEEFADSNGEVIPKVKIKSYRKESLNVRL